jgi:hypothetical protein
LVCYLSNIIRPVEELESRLGVRASDAWPIEHNEANALQDRLLAEQQRFQA